jgi:cyclophilin family peptidyl-prolyl cis-trans isomerase
MRIIISALFLLASILCFSQNKYSHDATLRKIYEFEYERNSDSLLPFLKNSNQWYRFATIKSISSVQDTNFTPILLEMLHNENVDSIKLAMIYSISQLDCYTAYNGLLKYFQTSTKPNIKNACLEAIGKVSKRDLTGFYYESFTANNKADNNYLSAWMRGVYLAKRRKNIDLHKSNQSLELCLNKILENFLGLPDEVNYYYSKLMNDTKIELVDVPKTPIKTLSEIETKLKSLGTPYLQLEELKKYEISVSVCQALIISAYHPLIKTHALDIYLTKFTWNNKVDQTFIQSIFDLMDVALTSRMCEYIVQQKQNNKAIDITIDILQNTQRQLFLPRDFETWIDLEKAILSFEGKTYQYKSCFETGYKNPIDWNYVIKINATQKVKITTNKGSMQLSLYVNESPASVANFLKLVDNGYYEGKYFHRLVSNFVIQGGCPRGDGWGALDWNQRSELSGKLRYRKGSVGLASVGKDSEGVQFFISYNYAPHLDGKYTIFAEVSKGFDVLNNLVLGDQIISIERIP